MHFTRQHLQERLYVSTGSAAFGEAGALTGVGASTGDDVPTGVDASTDVDVSTAVGAPTLPAAVLIGLVDRPGGPTVLLTKRTDHLKDHAGQICFPGGRIEPEDASVEAAALREAEEEIGLPPEKVDVIRRLAPYDTSTGFRIHPVVGWIEPPIEMTLDAFEVAEVFELPLAFILDPANHQRQSYINGDERRSYYVLPYEGRFIWGATAGMLVIFSKLLTP